MMKRTQGRGWRVTPLGVAFLLVLLASVVVVILASGGAQFWAAVVAAALLLLLAVGGVAGEGGESKSLEQRRAEVRAVDRSTGGHDVSDARREEMWEREAQRYREKHKPH